MIYLIGGLGHTQEYFASMTAASVMVRGHGTVLGLDAGTYCRTGSQQGH